MDPNAYRDYVDHPRFGREPRVTGLNPVNSEEGVHLHYRLSWKRKSPAIPNTAVLADLTAQVSSCIPVTHYFDEKRVCVDCGRRFIFFAEEQKYWYEEICFDLACDCVRCVPCRKKLQGIARKRERYEELFHAANRSADETLEMATCCLELIEEEIFSAKSTQTVRMLLNQLPEVMRSEPAAQALRSRLADFEGGSGDARATGGSSYHEGG